VSGSADITQLVPAARLARFHAIVGQDPGTVDGFYRWAQNLSLALFADIAILEVVMRSAMAGELSQTYGRTWYMRPDLFDDDTARALSTTWTGNGLGPLRDAGANEDVIEGKLVAGLTFGFWVQLLGRGSYAGKQPLRQRRIYDTLLWQPALSKAFPHAPSRTDTERRANVVKAARNRIAHHEQIAWGIPLPGQRTRLTVSEVHDRLHELAGFISPDAGTWITANSTLQQQIASCPVDATRLSL
jgi:hypothetical protein